jgi:glycosyltransferase involved in cell wall biosynthesis
LSSVSVVISTYTTERLHYLLDCIESLTKQTLQPKEIILILDAAGEKTLEFYKSRIPHFVKIVDCRKSGLSNARNAGVAQAEGEIIGFIDDDAIADKDWLRNLVRNYSDQRVLGVGGLVKPIWENGRPRWFAEELDWIVGCSHKGGIDQKTCTTNPIGCNMSFRQKVFETVGIFKPSVGRNGTKLFGGEETELCLRICEQFPWAIVIHDPEAVVFHRIPRNRASVRYMIKRAFYGGLSKAIVRNSARLNPGNALLLYKSYLKYLLTVSIPLRLKRVDNSRSLSQLFAILTTVYVVLLGYCIGRLLNKPR